MHDHEHEAERGAVSPDYGHLHAEVPQPSVAKIGRLRWALIITGIVMLVEVVGGLLTNSLALLSDAGHMFTHIFALGMSYLAILITARPADRERTFGYFRAEILAALVNGLLLFAAAVLIFYEALKRILQPVPVHTMEMLLVAAVGLAANLASVALLARVSGEDLNLKSAFIHVVYDTVSSIAVVGAALLMEFTGWQRADPIVGVMIGVLILIWASRIVRDSASILLESTPKGVDTEHIRKDMCSVPGVRSVHDIHVWQITTNMHVMTAHVVVENMRMAECGKIVEEINHVLREHHKIGHTTLQLECEVSPEEERATSPREWMQE